MKTKKMTVNKKRVDVRRALRTLKKGGATREEVEQQIFTPIRETAKREQWGIAELAMTLAEWIVDLDQVFGVKK